METFRCLIVDDEKPARDLIKNYIDKIPELELTGVCENALQAKSHLNRNRVDILFLDIQMPDLSGTEFLRSLPIKPATILITAFSEFALEGYELDVIDYLVKPVEFSRFYKAVSRAMDWLGKKKLPPVQQPTPATEQNFKNYIFVKTDKEIIKVRTREILFIESVREYVKIYTLKKKILTLQSLSRMEEILPTQQFFRVHRSYIVNIEMIENIIGNTIFIREFRIPISRGRRQEFLELINRDKLF